jgi:prepilin-type N-terminal cleavage/methylation domain-containing protein
MLRCLHLCGDTEVKKNQNFPTQKTCYNLSMDKKRGFTLLELLVVITCIAILATVIVVATAPARARARDSKRIQDIRQTRNALELYHLDHGTYPPGIYGTVPLVHNNETGGRMFTASVQLAQLPRTTSSPLSPNTGDSERDSIFLPGEGSTRITRNGGCSSTPVRSVNQTLNSSTSASELVSGGYISTELCHPDGSPYFFVAFDSGQGYHLGAELETDADVLEQDADFDSTGRSDFYGTNNYPADGFDGALPKVFDITNTRQLY